MKRHPRNRRAALAACVLALSGAAAACGSKPVDAVQVLAAAPDKTLAASSARIVVDLRADTAGRTVTVHESGAIDLRRKAGTLRLDGAQFGLPIGDIETRLVGGAIYVDFAAIIAKGGEQLPPLLRAKRWLKVDLKNLQEGAAAVGNDPSSFTDGLQYLRGVAKDGVHEVGPAEVRGTSTTQYGVDVDITTLRRKLRDAKISDSSRRLYEQGFDRLGTGTIHTDVWVDHHGLVRRQAFTLPVNTAGRTATVHMRVDFFDFGVAVDTQPPPADEVFDLADLAGAPGTTS
jgi:hypothetical protein